MIGTTKKTFETVLAMLEGLTSIGIVGCGDCATSCQTGGEKQVAEIAELLAAQGKEIVAKGVIDVACDKRLVKKFFREHASFAQAEAVLVLACGSGVQTVSEAGDVVALPGLDSLMIGQIENLSNFVERCSVCGDCVLDRTAGICPVTRCSKGLRNGPCGGSDNGKCESDREQDCAWFLIYERIQKHAAYRKLAETQPVVSRRNAHKPRKIQLKRHI